MDLTLYRAVGNLNRVALGDLSSSEFYAASRDERTGIITLQPVNIVDGTTKRPAAADEPEAPTLDGPPPADVPWGADNA